MGSKSGNGQTTTDFEQIARGAVADLRRYAYDLGAERRLVSAAGYEEEIAALDAKVEASDG